MSLWRMRYYCWIYEWELAQAARAWYYAVMNREVPKDESMPRTVSGIRARLVEAGSHYARRVR
jgi:hypothetical protein